MDLTYPAAVESSLDRLDKALTDVCIEDETEACGRDPVLWAARAPLIEVEVSSPLIQFAVYRKFGAYTLPLGELLRVTALGSRNATAPWSGGESLAVQLNGGRLTGQVFLPPVCVPTNEVVLLARKDDAVVLVRAAQQGSRIQRVGDALSVTFEEAPGVVLNKGDEALATWERLVRHERLGLLGLTLGVIDRSWHIALDALCQGKRYGNILADEQVAQFQLSDIHIDRLAAEHLALDVAIEAEQGRASDAELALAR